MAWSSSTWPSCSASSSSTSAARTPTAPSTWTAVRIRVSLTPSFYGHSIGWWDGDTLERGHDRLQRAFWLDRRGSAAHRGAAYAREVHTHESGDREYEVTVDDPGAYTASVDDDVQPAPRERTGALRIRVPAGELRRRADGRRQDVRRSRHDDHSVTHIRSKGKGQRSKARANVIGSGQRLLAKV